MTTSSFPKSRSTGEAAFAVSELFFSRTDRRGVIQSGNPVFQRISKFEWRKMIGAPHKLVRHPDMPKGVFWLMWKTLEEGRSIAAYVVNRTAENEYYWVLANISPVDDGYVSVRLKPTTAELAEIASIYDEMRSKEADENLSPEQSAQLLLERLAERNFEDYETFMTHALATETASRDEKLSRPPSDAIIVYQELLQLLRELRAQGNDITRRFGEIRSLQTNMQIKARRMGSSSSALSVISINFSSLADEIRECIDTFLSNSQRTIGSVRHVLHLACSRRLQEDIIAQFAEEETKDIPIDVNVETHRLTRMNDDYSHQGRSSLAEMLVEVEEFRDTCLELKRTLAALGVTRVMSQIENERSDSEEDGVGQVIVRLKKFHEDTQKSIRDIERGSNRLHMKITQHLGTTHLARAG